MSAEFVCNICGKENNIYEPFNREFTRTACCNSSPRMRMIVHVLSMELFGKSLALPNFPERNIKGIGISDWEGYAIPLAAKLNYTNTYYHKEPRLDIANVSESWKGKYDFVICSDVMEHVEPPVLRGFQGLSDLLKPGGVVIFSVPYMYECGYQEYYPNLYKYKIVEIDGQKVLKNVTRDGNEEEFTNLWMHGGDGAVLAMRLYTEQKLVEDFLAVGFNDMKIYRAYMPFGAFWPESYSQLWAVRKASQNLQKPKHGRRWLNWPRFLRL